MRKISYIQAINESLKYEMNNDENVIIMGYNTWISIPEEKRPLKNRMNLIL